VTNSTAAKPCSTGCGRPVIARTLCGACYMQAKRAGTLPERKESKCSQSGCDKPHKARGFCAAHYYQAKNAGRIVQLGTCTIGGCSSTQSTRKLCIKHYRRLIRHGDPLWEPPAKVTRTCHTDGCEQMLGRGSAQGMCSKHYQQWWAAKNPEKLAAYRETGRAAGWSRKSHLMRNFGITAEQYTAMLQAQEGRCAICGSKFPGRFPSFHVDHDHKTGNIRGLLCNFCNLGLGSMRDNPEILERAAAYVRHHSVPIRESSPTVRNGYGP
jgi:recombination endonuclease VII